jgi:hypothetical protein
MAKRIDDRDLVDISGAGDGVVPAPKDSGANPPSSTRPGAGSGGSSGQGYDTPGGDDDSGGSDYGQK